MKKLRRIRGAEREACMEQMKKTTLLVIESEEER
jgi:hypothetical protein